MPILRTHGFSQLIQEVAHQARRIADTEAALRWAATLGGRLPADLAMNALAGNEKVLYQAAADHAELVQAIRSSGDRILLTETGRLRIAAEGTDLPPHAAAIGTLNWPAGRPAALGQAVTAAAERDRQMMGTARNWLLEQSPGFAAELIGHLQLTLAHVGPVRVYVGSEVYTNLGHAANLIGKSVAAGSRLCVLTKMSQSQAVQWTPEDACFAVGMTILLRSGTPSRAEEFSGTQLLPDRLASFLAGRLKAYQAPCTVPPHHDTEALLQLAEQCAIARAAALRRGVRPYRIVHALNVHKQEHLSERPVRLRDVPGAVLLRFADLFGTSVPRDFDAVTAVSEKAMPWLHSGAGYGFSSRLEEAIHEIVGAATSALHSDVGLSRGPRRIGELSALMTVGGPGPAEWTTSDYFCCVTPSPGFGTRFMAAPGELAGCLRAMGARMRFNSWHFMPHSAGITAECPDRDWFFAPSMPDITNWTDQHHQGHVANGVRHAIRVPFGIRLAGTFRPGIHDFRLLRTAGPVYELADLHAAVAVGEILQRIYQAHASRIEETGADHPVTDFTNPWYKKRYDVTSLPAEFAA